MAEHDQEYYFDPLLFDENGEVDIDQLIENLGPTEAGNPWFNVNNVPITPENDPNCIETGRCVAEQLFFDPAPEPIQIGDFAVNNTTTETVREYEAFGIKLNDADDFATIGILALVVVLVYIGKCAIDLWFACAFERWKDKRNNGR